MLLRICLPSAKLVWPFEMKAVRRGLSLLVITLEIILYTTLHKVMALDLSSVIDFRYFGIKSMKEALRDFITVLDLLESSTTSRISCLTDFQQDLKKTTLKPSGPRAFPFCISLITLLTSCLDIGMLILWLSSMVTNLGMNLVYLLMNRDMSTRGSSIILRKCWTRKNSISLLETSSFPWESLSFEILLWDLRSKVDLWKIFVFLFPSLIHCTLYFYLQKISSFMHRPSHLFWRESAWIFYSSVNLMRWWSD